MKVYNDKQNPRDGIRILVIDDHQEIRTLVANYLESRGYQVETAENGLDGIFLLEQWPADVVTVDLNMPVMDGHQFIKKALERWPDLPIIVVSGIGAVNEAVEALRRGARDFVTKPIENFTLVDNTIAKVLESARLLQENRHYQENLEKMVRDRTTELEAVKHQLLYSLGKSAEYRDNETGRHVIRVGKICELLGLAMEMTEPIARTFGEAAPLHDIGKIGISDSILLKPGELSPEEWQIMKTHCEIGCDILRPYTSVKNKDVALDEIVAMGKRNLEELSLLEIAMVIALCHHERWDGGGYPSGLSGLDIPTVARITTVVDVYDALGSKRPYKEALPDEICQKIIREGSGSHFDPGIVDVFFANIDEITQIKKEWED